MQKPETRLATGLSQNEQITESAKKQLEAEKKIADNVMSIRLSSDGLIIKDEPGKQQSDEYGDTLPGVYCEGIQYFDLTGVHYINNTGMAILIDILKSLLEMGVEVQFVNVGEKIKKKIKEIGLENIINCDEN
jgi:ABC-type transporter Mla MlaB component